MASGAYQAIIASMPMHEIYIEPFLGSGAIARAKPPARFSLLSDIYPAAVERFTWPHAARAEIGVADYKSSLAAGLELVAGDYGRGFVYCDPPYMHETRSDKRYTHDFTDDDHLELVELLLSISDRVFVAVSGYFTDLYATRLKSWRLVKFQAMTRGGPRTECLWMNYDLERVGAFSGAYAGSDFTDRQRVKRKAERWARNYAAMPAGERAAVLAAMMATGK